MKCAYAAASAALLGCSGLALAQVPPDIAAKTQALGRTMNPAEGYSPWDGRFDLAFWDGMSIRRGIAYGADAAQVLDLYRPGEGGGEVRPVMVFVHGGGFVGGSRSGRPYPDNVLGWAVGEGMIGVSIDYRLAPTHPWPAGAQDLSSALRWVRENIAQHGGDPDRIVLFGHSAGANHVADYVAHTEVQGSEAHGVKGAILLSPGYALERPSGAAHPYYNTAPDMQWADVVIDGLGKSPVPVFLGVAELDPEAMRAFAERARDWLCQKPESCPEFVDLADHNHFTEGLSLGTEDRSLAEPLLAWMRLNRVF
jgi:acetyl esterase/lipase